MKKILLTLVGVICSLGMWADDVTLANVDFSADVWSRYTSANPITSETTTSKEINGYSFKGFKTNGFYVDEGSLVFPGNNMSDNYYLGIPLTGINGTLTIKVNCPVKGASFRYEFADGGTKSSTNQTTEKTDADGNVTISISNITSAEGTFFIGRNSSSYTKINSIIITTPYGIESNLAVSSSTASVNIKETTDVTYTTSSTGAVKVDSSNESVATATAANGTVTITGVAAGTATITLSQAADNTYNSGSKTITVTVTDPNAPTVVYNWSLVSEEIVGTTTLEGDTQDQVKIKNVKTNGIKLSGSLSATSYVKIEPETGEFKAGDVISWTGCIYNSDAQKDGAIMIATASDGKGFTILDASDKFNNTYDTSVEASTGSFTLPYDVDALYIGRTNKKDYLSSPTATWLTELKVSRPVEAPTTYSITVAATENGSVTAPATAAIEGSEIILKVSPASGYELESLKVNDGNVEVSDKTFTMPAEDVTITATFKAKTTTITLGTNGYSTFASEYPCTISGATAYMGTYDGEVVTLKAIEGTIPAGAGVVLVGEEGAKVTATGSSETAADMTDNVLKGVISSTTELETSGTNYVLSTNKNTSVTAFVKMSSSKVVADMVGKAYLNIPASEAKVIYFAGDATAIKAVETEKATATNGKFIKNGKFVIVKNGKQYNAVGTQVK